MAYDSKNLSALAYANGFTLWHYKSSADAKAAIDTAGYFNDASNMLRVGDLIIAQDSASEVGFMRVSSNASGVVDVNDMVSAGTTDTD